MATFTSAFFVLVSSPFVHGMADAAELPEQEIFFSRSGESGNAGFGPFGQAQAFPVAIEDFVCEDSCESISTAVARKCDPDGYAQQIAEHGLLGVGDENTDGNLSRHNTEEEHYQYPHAGPLSDVHWNENLIPARESHADPPMTEAADAADTDEIITQLHLEIQTKALLVAAQKQRNMVDFVLPQSILDVHRTSSTKITALRKHIDTLNILLTGQSNSGQQDAAPVQLPPEAAPPAHSSIHKKRRREPSAPFGPLTETTVPSVNSLLPLFNIKRPKDPKIRKKGGVDRNWASLEYAQSWFLGFMLDSIKNGKCANVSARELRKQWVRSHTGEGCKELHPNILEHVVSIQTLMDAGKHYWPEDFTEEAMDRIRCKRSTAKQERGGRTPATSDDHDSPGDTARDTAAATESDSDGGGEAGGVTAPAAGGGNDGNGGNGGEAAGGGRGPASVAATAGGSDGGGEAAVGGGEAAGGGRGPASVAAAGVDGGGRRPASAAAAALVGDVAVATAPGLVGPGMAPGEANLAKAAVGESEPVAAGNGPLDTAPAAGGGNGGEGGGGNKGRGGGRDAADSLEAQPPRKRRPVSEAKKKEAEAKKEAKKKEAEEKAAAEILRNKRKLEAFFLKANQAAEPGGSQSSACEKNSGGAVRAEGDL